ncbi:DUF4097 family beta strand repeat-containing protein [Aquibacillus koreensis]|uniref:DUF4097 family beta strand repeat-containing protein n=1 Tax=Aquibacillus koreensis TaxID=279446 RepID=A0A9X4AJ47_9BACI|nr:DUF4097 domain-containing protein [Aquibacillus koreensis]MCT2537299.1 DUF4097 family beta strand repeat-containing protein [Aquibacillus koreensis]MDC3421646.1 DUF4097 family beta strand repeat-containing protein [Aquibacillus koreensis]
MKEDRKRILKMVEEGLISAEEAAELFESLDKADKAEKAEKEPNQLTEQVKWDQGESYYSQNKKQSTTSKKAKLLSLVEEAFTKIKNVDLDFNFGTHTVVSHIFHSQNVDVSNLDIDIANGSLTLSPWNEADVRIECEAKVYQVDDKDRARQNFLDTSAFHVDEKQLHFSVPSKQIKTDVVMKIPERLYEKISVKLFNGPVNAESVKTKQLRVKTSNGDVTLKRLEGKLLFVETGNGKITTDQVMMEEVETETMNGAIHLDGQFHAVDAQTVNGSIQCAWEGENTRTGFFRTTTGSIRLHVPNTVKIEGKLESNIGGLHCDLHNYQVVNETKEVIKRTLQFEAQQEHSALLHIEAETKTGSIWVLPNK